MKPVGFPIPPKDAAQAATARFERERVLHRAIGELYYQVEIAAGVASYNGAITEVTVNSAVVMRMPNGATTSARRIVRGRDLWVNTRLRFDVWYTSPVGSTANFGLLGVYWAHDLGGAIGGAGLSVAWTAPGPAVAGTPMFTSAVLASRIMTSPREVVRVSFSRTDPDDNVNDLDVLLVVARFEELA